MPIKVLPPGLASKIAAGEVVERPASVVKELVENSLDAGASHIVAEIAAGGVDQLRVTDDGLGIPASEVELAFQRHATSKLDHEDQLGAVATLGFRGEALPSIAAASHLTMTTRTREAAGGYQIVLHWGEVVRSGAHGCAPGATVEVADLFGNLPARRKFLKSNSAEAARVQELVSRYSLAYPWVRFQLVTDGRPTLSTPGNGKPRETLLALYGAEAASAMLEVQGENPETGSTYPGLRVDGFVSPPNLHRGNRSYMTFFVNRRWVQSRMLAYCVEQAYHGLLPEKRYPLTAVNLTLPYEDVDVNSHPAKREVRFHQEGKVFSTVQRAVRAAVVSESPVPRLVSSSQWSATGSPATGHSSLATSFFAPSPVSSGQWPATGSSATDHSPLATDHQPRPAAPTLKVVGQVKFTYIVAEGPEGMFLVDQHAAHERVLFDRIVLRSASKTPETQPLLQPVTLELTPSQAELLNSNLENLASFGFQVEGFGGATYLLRSVPSAMTTHDPGQSLIDVLDTAAFEGVVRQQEDILAATIACHSAIRAGSPLAEAEMRGLLEQLELADNPHTCPHGRPTMLHISSYQVEREFGRR